MNIKVLFCDREMLPWKRDSERVSSCTWRKVLLGLRQTLLPLTVSYILKVDKDMTVMVERPGIVIQDIPLAVIAKADAASTNYIRPFKTKETCIKSPVDINHSPKFTRLKHLNKTLPAAHTQYSFRTIKPNSILPPYFFNRRYYTCLVLCGGGEG